MMSLPCSRHRRWDVAGIGTSGRAHMGLRSQKSTFALFDGGTLWPKLVDGCS